MRYATSTLLVGGFLALAVCAALATLSLAVSGNGPITGLSVAGLVGSVLAGGVVAAAFGDADIHE